MSNRTVLVDGDIIAYRVGFACEHKEYYATIDGEDMIFTSKLDLNAYVKEHESEEIEWESRLNVEPVSFALSTLKHLLTNLRADTKSDQVEIYLTGKENFRDHVGTILKYKGNRDERRKPMLYEDICRYLSKFHGAIIIDGVEADDMLATRQHDLMARGEESVIASDDKDLLQIPGLHYNLRTRAKVRVSEETANKNKYIQILSGDTTDNIPGVYLMGPKTAAKVLDEVEPSQYRNVVEDCWHNYLCGNIKGKTPDWLQSYNPDTNEVVYVSHDERIRVTTLTDLVDEIERLVTIGVPDGRQTRRRTVPDSATDQSD